MKKLWIVLSLIIGTLSLMTLDAEAAESREQRVITAQFVDHAITIDGILDESAWTGKSAGNFIQSKPDDGKPATEKTEVWVAYDKKSLYIAARLHDSEPDKIIGRLGRRDDFVDSDWFTCSIDPYYDRRSGFLFAVNPSGTIVDRTLSNDEGQDSAWDGVWESATNRDQSGWTVEIKIPFNQLRFKPKDQYTWGINFRRIIKRKNEKSGFVWIPREESGFVSHFARLEGIRDIKPGRHIEIVPYSIARASYSPVEEGNPFATGEDYFASAGVDLKVGLKSNLTLDVSINPDFGQVEVDPAVINLSAAESYYEEKRPFFIEGSSIFSFGYGGSNRNIGANWGNPTFFYSRRIGHPPQGYATGDGYISSPDWTTILGAAKITGKIGNGWNVGFLTALTEREYATLDNNGARSTQEIEPFSHYGVLRVQKEFNEGRQGLGLIATSILRDLRNESLMELLNDNAFSFGIDGWTFLDKDKVWVVSGWLGGTTVSGPKEAIGMRQQAYPHYFQRPDADHVEYDSEATSMNGWAGRFSLNKQKGNFVFNAAVGAISPGFDSTDMGFMWNSDVINGHIMAGYRTFKPGKIFRNWEINVFTQRNYNFDGDKIGEQRLIFIGHGELKNFWDVYAQYSYNPEKWSHSLTRGGPKTLVPEYSWGELGIFSDDRKPVVMHLFSGFSTSVSGSHGWFGSLELHWKPSSNVSISLEPSYQIDHEVSQWVSNIEDPLMTSTFGNRYMFATLDQKTLSCSIRINWTFNPKISLQAYLQPFIAVGDYYGFKELSRPSSYAFNVYGENHSTIAYGDDEYRIDADGPGPAAPFSIGNPDFNYKSLRGTVVLRWEYRPGSIIYFVWTQNRWDYANPGDLRFSRDFRNLIQAPGDDIFMIKFTYRFKL
jgi:hypothetical protein